MVKRNLSITFQTDETSNWVLDFIVAGDGEDIVVVNMRWQNGERISHSVTVPTRELERLVAFRRNFEPVKE